MPLPATRSSLPLYYMRTFAALRSVVWVGRKFSAAHDNRPRSHSFTLLPIYLCLDWQTNTFDLLLHLDVNNVSRFGVWTVKVVVLNSRGYMHFFESARLTVYCPEQIRCAEEGHTK